MTIAEFLLARIAEDEANIRGPWAQGDGGLHLITVAASNRMLAECASKRAIVDRAACGHCEPVSDEIAWVLRVLSWPYADHEDYREEWRP